MYVSMMWEIKSSGIYGRGWLTPNSWNESEEKENDIFIISEMADV